MPKEFAFLFYVNDWAGGTQWLTRLQRGGYLDLLLYQVNNTSFTLDEARLILGEDFENIWAACKSKFSEIDGKFLNEKMQNVLKNRKKFTDSRRLNRLGKVKNIGTSKKNKTSKSLVKLVEKEKEIEKVIDYNNGEAKKFKIPTIQEVRDYCNERKNSVNASRFVDFYESKGWKIGKNKMKDWRAAVRTWEQGNNNDKPDKFKLPLNGSTNFEK